MDRKPLHLRLLQPGEDQSQVLRHDRADMLVADDAAAIDDEGFRHARRAQRDLHAACVVGADTVERVAVARRGNRRHPRAGREWRCRRSSTPLAFSSPSSGASAMHGTHQLAKTVDQARLAARKIGRRQGRAGRAAPAASVNAGTACRSAASESSVSGGRRQAPGDDADEQPASSASGTKRRVRLMRTRLFAAPRRRSRHSRANQREQRRPARSGSRRARSR